MSDSTLTYDGEPLEKWLQDAHPSSSSMLAHRAAMRALPLWIATMTAAWTKTFKRSALPLLRLNLTVAAARGRADDKILSAIQKTIIEIDLDRRARTAAGIFDSRDVLNDADSAYDAVQAAFSSCEALISTKGLIAAEKAYDAVNSLLRAVEGYSVSDEHFSIFERSIWDSLQGDIEAAASDEHITARPLWRLSNPLATSWEASIPILHGAPGGAFWIDWYQRALDGRPQNWPLLRDVALIDNALWQAGGDELDREISRIAERYRLLEEVYGLKAELAKVRAADAALAHRGHNHPPELISSDASELAGAVDALSIKLDDAEQELERKQPSPSQLQSIGRAIKGLASAFLRYCGGFTHKTLQASADELGKSLGKWAGPALGFYLASQSPKIIELADALIRLAGKYQ